MGSPLGNRVEYAFFSGNHADLTTGTIDVWKSDSDGPVIVATTVITTALDNCVAAGYELQSFVTSSATLATWVWRLERRPVAWEAN